MNLNENQKKIVIAGVVLFVLMGLFPPWTYTLDHESTHRKRPAGYALILEPPGPESTHVAFGVEIDVWRLLVQWLVLGAAIGVALLLVREKG